MSIQTKLAAGIISLGTAFGANAQPCETPWIDGREVGRQLQAVPVDQWNMGFLAQISQKTLADVRRQFETGMNRLGAEDERALRRVERHFAQSAQGRSREIDQIELMGNATPSTRAAIEQLLAGRSTVQEARLQATIDTLRANGSRLEALNGIQSSGCLAVTVAPAPQR